MDYIFSVDFLVALGQVIVIDLVLAGDNAIVIGLAAAGLPAHQRTRAILFGIIAATLLRISFAVVTTQLLQVIGLLLAGGILLLWVCWKMWQELRHSRTPEDEEDMAADTLETRGTTETGAPVKTLRQAIIQITLADVSMSLDNVLAVAGAAREHPEVLIFGLALSIALMGIAASLIARLLARYHWISYIGLAIILYVALEMMYRGTLEVWPFVENGARAAMGG